jgi:hypothetical protein
MRGVDVTPHNGFSDHHAGDHVVEVTTRDHFALCQVPTMAYSISAR